MSDLWEAVKDQPDNDKEPSGTDPAGNAYDVQWTSFDADGDVTFVDVYSDEDNIKGGATLVGQYEPDDGIFIWNFGNISGGDYYVFIRIMDEKGAIGDDFSDGVIHITQALEGPSSVENWALLE